MLADKQGVGIVEFARIFFELNDLKPEENLFHLVSIIDLYQQIQQSMRTERNIHFADFTDFHYEVPTFSSPPLTYPPLVLPREGHGRLQDSDLQNASSTRHF